MSTLQEAVQQAVAGEAIDPAYLDEEPENAAASYARVFHYFVDHGPAFVRLTNYPGGPCSECGTGLIRKLVAKVPGVVRFDGCCANCGENEFHTAGWTNDEAGDEASASARAKAVS